MTSKRPAESKQDFMQEEQEAECIMDVDQELGDDSESDADSIISTSLPSSFLVGLEPLECRRVSTSMLSTPQGPRNLKLLVGERDAATPKRRVIAAPEQREELDFLSTPTKVHGLTPPLMAPKFSRSSSLLTRLHEKGTLLGKHSQTPSPSDELGTRAKGFRSLPLTEYDRPLKLPDFRQPQTPTLDRSSASYSPIPPPDFGTPPGTPSKSQSFNWLSSSQQQVGSRESSPFGENDSDYNPFLGSSKSKPRFELDYLSESQWYSEYPHHLTKEYLEDLFRLDKRVMFTKTKSGSRDYPDYLTSNFYVSETCLGAGQFSDVLKVQSKNTKEFFAVKKLIKTFQGAMERKRYLSEVRNMWRVEKSSNVLQLLEAWEQKGRLYMRMELCKLGSLQSALIAQKKYGGFDEHRTWRCLTDIASGLRAIHDSNVIHLDIKPENIFITSAGALKIGDFGLSITYPIEVKDIQEGDKFYMAQELLNGACGKYTDIFSLGMTIYEMVTNQIGGLPGGGPEWHRLRDGDVDLRKITIGEALEETPSSSDTPVGEAVKSVETTTTATSTSVASASAPESASMSSTLSDLGLAHTIRKPVPRRLFAKDLLDLVKEMIQPDYEQRPTAAAILGHPTIWKILSKRNEHSTNGVRSDEAMSGLLLQSV
ncbi:hypothetical protein BG011_005034 [Mortierella polycephala]|uniref:Protein kinase domain-containing protein n=1 Tax=Mortierella polycephala TaxID=41804 RepID=A0A9P6PX52_9FUNG|nr:hypothetical protein BG011_005034 [Mortierella polycephala]